MPVTTTTRKLLMCECGHEGYLKCRENDQPFSGLWESYSLEGFEGASFTITSYKDMPPSILAKLRPTCPRCGRTGGVQFKKTTSN